MRTSSKLLLFGLIAFPLAITLLQTLSPASGYLESALVFLALGGFLAVILGVVWPEKSNNVKEKEHDQEQPEKQWEEVVARIVATSERHEASKSLSKITDGEEQEVVVQRPKHLDDFWFLVPTILLIVSLAPLPYGYYQFLRLAVSISAGVIVYSNFNEGRPLWTCMFGIICILFNPIFPIHLSRELWIPIDIATAAIFILGWRTHQK